MSNDNVKKVIKKRNKIIKKMKIRRIISLLVLLTIILLVSFTINLVRLNRNKFSIFMAVNGASNYDNSYLKQKIEEIDMYIEKPSYQWKSEIKRQNIPKKIIIHHSGTEKENVNQIHDYHKERGWDGIGYHYYINKDGDIFKGRDDDMIGAHTKGQNNSSIGICLEGNFESENIENEQFNSLLNLCRDLVVKYNISDIEGHRDNGDTLCPGSNIDIEKVKNGVYKKIDDLIE